MRPLLSSVSFLGVDIFRGLGLLSLFFPRHCRASGLAYVDEWVDTWRRVDRVVQCVQRVPTASAVLCA